VIRASGILLWTVLLWVLLWGGASAANVLGGAVVGAVVLTVARLPRRASADDAVHVAPLATLRFGAFVLVKLVEANLVLAWEIITPRNRINTGVVEVPLRTGSDLAMMVVANVITLTPGTVTLEVAGEPPVLYVNVLHLHDLDRVRRDLLRIEELSVRAFGTRGARRELAEQLAGHARSGS
jgi:multicomponent Na+:H+ antiporter subunit E